MVLGLWYLHPALLMRLTGSVNDEMTNQREANVAQDLKFYWSLVEIHMS